jgi:hypothetical protein
MLPSNFTVVKYRSLLCAGHVAGMRQIKNTYRILVGDIIGNYRGEGV